MLWSLDKALSVPQRTKMEKAKCEIFQAKLKL